MNKIREGKRREKKQERSPADVPLLRDKTRARAGPSACVRERSKSPISFRANAPALKNTIYDVELTIFIYFFIIARELSKRVYRKYVARAQYDDAKYLQCTECIKVYTRWAQRANKLRKSYERVEKKKRYLLTTFWTSARGRVCVDINGL